MTDNVEAKEVQNAPKLLQNLMQIPAWAYGAFLVLGICATGGMPVWAAVLMLVGGGLSLFASSNPDGLEWSIANVTGSEELESDGSVQASVAQIQESTAVRPDSGFADADESSAAGGTATAGIVGVVCTFALAGGVAWIISRTKKKKRAALHSQL